MSDIKFRAWNKKDNQILDWFTLSQSAWNTFRGDKPISLIYEILVARIDDFILMRFTGLLDKNGKEIYEGDLIHRHMNVYWKVVFKESKWIAESTEGFSSLYLDARQFIEAEIVGNIFENPELLK